MRKIIALLVLVSIVCVSCAALAAEQPPVKVEQVDVAGEIAAADGKYVLETGKLYHIALEANATTGYAWSAELSDASLTLIAEGYDYVSPADGSVGVGGTQHYFFRAESAGECALTLRYKQPWMEDSAEDTTIAYAFVIK